MASSVFCVKTRASMCLPSDTTFILSGVTIDSSKNPLCNDAFVFLNSKHRSIPSLTTLKAMEPSSALSSTIVSKVVSVVFSVLTVLTFLSILIYTLVDISRLTKDEFLVRTADSITDEGVQRVCGATLPLVVKYRGSSETRAARRPRIFAGQHHVYEMLRKDPFVSTAAAVSDFAHNYSPFHARKYRSAKQQLGGNQGPQRDGTAFVLPSGYVVNKSVGMDGRDLETWTFKEAPDSEKITPRCATAPFVTRTNIFGYENSTRNSLALVNGTTEVLVCPCPYHANLLEAPARDSFSEDPATIEYVEDEKEFRFPAAGLSVIRNRQVTTQRNKKPNSAPTVSNNEETYAVPVYGTNLVVLPDDDFTLALNCPCTGRKDGSHAVGKDSSGLLHRDVMGYFNANPVHMLHASRGNKDAWVATGKSISSITCEGEKVKAIT